MPRSPESKERRQRVGSALKAAEADTEKVPEADDSKIRVRVPKKHRETAKKLIAATRENKRGERDRKEALATLLPFARVKYVGGATEGPYRDHVVLDVGDDDESPPINVIFSHKYSEIPLDQAKVLREIVGRKFAACFETVKKVTLKDAVAKSEKKLDSLIRALGGEQRPGKEEEIAEVGKKLFAENFDVKRFLAPTRHFTEERWQEFTAEENAALDEIITQSAPQVRIDVSLDDGDDES